MKVAVNKSLLSSDATQKFLAFASLIILFVFFTFASPNFFQFGNIVSIVLATCVNGLLALGVTFVIITGGIDLSVGTMMTLSAVMSGVFITQMQLPVAVGIIGAVSVGAICGSVNGFMVSKMKIPAFIATLGMMMLTKGLAMVIAETKPIYFNDIPQYNKIAMGSVLNSIFPGFNVPNSVLIFIFFAILASFILSQTILGRYTFAIGSNEEATRLSGVNIALWKIGNYALCGAFCGLAGILISSRLNSAQPALGQGYELEAIAAVVIGGTSLNGGEGTILGTVIGAFIMSVLTNGLRILSVKQEWQTVIVGLVVIAAVYTDIIRRNKK